MPDLSINDFSRLPHAIIAVDLTINGEPVHMEAKVPLYLWDEMGRGARADIVLSTIYRGLARASERFVDNVTVIRNERPGATVGRLAGLELSRFADRYDI